MSVTEQILNWVYDQVKQALKITGDVSISGRTLISAGKKTDADATDRVITPPSAFNRISVINDGAVELRLCVNADSTAGAKIIYVKPGEHFEDDLAGATLHYSVASGTAAFRYILY